VSREVETATPRWYAVHTKVQEENRAAYNLQAWRVETFHPKIREPRYNQFTGKPVYTTKSLFGRYIFARFDADTLLHKVCHTRGVHSVVSCGRSYPISIDDKIIELIQSQVGADGFVKETTIKPAEIEFNFGDEVRIKDGPLRDLIGLFEGNINETDRVKILLTTINFQGSAVVERGLVQKAS
jgi:transcription antitermination factor NusG